MFRKEYELHELQIMKLNNPCVKSILFHIRIILLHAKSIKIVLIDTGVDRLFTSQSTYVLVSNRILRKSY